MAAAAVTLTVVIPKIVAEIESVAVIVRLPAVLSSTPENVYEPESAEVKVWLAGKPTC